MERVQRKLRRLLVVSSLVMVAGLVAVFAAIFYRLSRIDTVSQPPELTLSVPEGATVRSATATGDRITLVLEGEGGKTSVHVFDAATGAERQTIRLISGPEE